MLMRQILSIPTACFLFLFKEKTQTNDTLQNLSKFLHFWY